MINRVVSWVIIQIKIMMGEHTTDPPEKGRTRENNSWGTERNGTYRTNVSSIPMRVTGRSKDILAISLFLGT